MASVAVQSGVTALGSLSLQSGSRCRIAEGLRSALPASKKPALQTRLHSKFHGKNVLLRPSAGPSHGPSMVVAAPPPPSVLSSPEDDNPSPFSGFDYAAKPPFSLADIRNAIPRSCWEKNTLRSLAYLARDVLVVFGMAAGAAAVNNWAVWPLYWLAQGTMFWALFVVGHDCGHGSFSSSKKLNDFIGHMTHSSILVPYHGWRISHRTHHQNHGHVENDESWHPVTESMAKEMGVGIRGRWAFPWVLLAFPLYLWKRSPGKEGSHYDPNCDLFTPGERNDVLTSNAYMVGMLAILATVGFTMGPAMLFKLYIMPYILNVVWLDVVTYLHHHGYDEKIPWYRGEEWNYMRGGLSTIDRDYGIFNDIHHDIGTHVVHHLFPQMPHYNLREATEAVKPVLGEYYREPEKSKGPIPVHLIKPLVESFQNDHVVPDEGDVVFYKKAF